MPESKRWCSVCCEFVLPGCVHSQTERDAVVISQDVDPAAERERQLDFLFPEMRFENNGGRPEIVYAFHPTGRKR